MSQHSLVIFDCDGVLVDSERIANESMQDSLQELGLVMSYTEIRTTFMGLSWPDCMKRIEELTGEPLPEGWLQRVQLRDQQWFRDQLQPVPGVREVIRAVKDTQLDYCVASSGDVEKMTLTLGITELLSHFEGRLYSATMVQRGKPHPDLFLHAATQQGHEPASCVVIEDSVHGVTGAVAAGMRVLAYAGDPHADVDGLKAAGGELFTDMREAPTLIGI